jgi:hypothetical protein
MTQVLKLSRHQHYVKGILYAVLEQQCAKELCKMGKKIC